MYLKPEFRTRHSFVEAEIQTATCVAEIVTGIYIRTAKAVYFRRIGCIRAHAELRIENASRVIGNVEILKLRWAKSTTTRTCHLDNQTDLLNPKLNHRRCDPDEIFRMTGLIRPSLNMSPKHRTHDKNFAIGPPRTQNTGSKLTRTLSCLQRCTRLGLIGHEFRCNMTPCNNLLSHPFLDKVFHLQLRASSPALLSQESSQMWRKSHRGPHKTKPTHRRGTAGFCGANWHKFVRICP